MPVTLCQKSDPLRKSHLHEALKGTIIHNALFIAPIGFTHMQL